MKKNLGKFHTMSFNYQEFIQSILYQTITLNHLSEKLPKNISQHFHNILLSKINIRKLETVIKILSKYLTAFKTRSLRNIMHIFIPRNYSENNI